MDFWSSTIGQFRVDGQITDTIGGDGGVVYIHDSTISEIINQGQITALDAGIWTWQSNVGLIANLDGASIVSTGLGGWNVPFGIYNDQSTITEIRNFGLILGPQLGASIGNRSIITNIHNAQGLQGGQARPLTIAGNLPENYFVIIRALNDYGRLGWVSVAGFTNQTPLMRFGVSQYSTGLAAGIYPRVLENIDDSEIDPATRSGTANGFAWRLSAGSSADSWDLLVMPGSANTQLGLQSNSSAVHSVLAQRAAATTFALDYDCSVFDQHGFCVSVGFRNSQMGSNYADSGETAGLLTAAYRVTPEFRIGGFIDQGLVSQSPTGVDPKNTQPMLGAFAVYQENPNFSGVTIRAALAYQEGDLRITRPELTGTEAGTGRAQTIALAFGGEIAYGFPLDNTWVAQPYAGMRRSDSQRRGYTETTSDSVEYPITYNRFGQQVNSATAGLRLRGSITPEFSLTFGAGMEHDLNSKMDRYAGTSTISGLESFSINASQQQNETRAVGSAGMRYMIASNQALAFDASVRQMPYGNDPSITTMLRYSIGF
jgi:hypothetical protein